MTRLLSLAAALTICAAAVPAHANGRLPATVKVKSRNDFVLLPTTFGLLLSSDSGASFQWICESNIGYGGTYDPDYAISANGDIWATTFDGLRVSHDGGCTFETLAGNLAGRFISDVEVGSDGRIWVGSATGGEPNDVFVSTDDGATFDSAGLPDDVSWWRSIQIAPSDPDTIYVAGFKLGDMANNIPAEALLRRSIDGGQNWDTLAVTDFAFGSQPNLFLLGVSPTDPTVLFARVLGARDPAGDDIYRSIDGGDTWTKVLEMGDFITAFQVVDDGSALDSQTVIAGTVAPCMGDAADAAKGCVQVSSDGGATFAAAASQPKMACIDQNDSGDLLACGSNWEPDNFALGSSKDKGASWQKVFRFSDIAGPLECPESSPQHECAAFDWPPLCVQLGICSATDAGPDGDGGTKVDEPTTCGCNASGAVLGVLVLLPWVRLRRPSTEPESDGEDA